MPKPLSDFNGLAGGCDWNLMKDAPGGLKLIADGLDRRRQALLQRPQDDV